MPAAGWTAITRSWGGPSRAMVHAEASPRASGQQELAVPGDHGAVPVVLPCDDADVRDAAPELEDLGARPRRRGTGGAQVVDAERDRLRHPVTAAVVDEAEQRRELQEGAEDAAVHGG